MNDRNNSRYSLGTIKAYKNLKTRLFDYKEDRTIPTLNYTSFDMDWYKDYMQYAINKGYNIASINNTIKNLKSILNRSYQDGYHNFSGYKDKRFKKHKEKNFKIYLTKEELSQLLGLDLTERPHLEKYRSIFIVGCYTGLRFSDLVRIKPHHIKTENDKSFIDIHTQKTNERVIIPINTHAKRILNTYDYKLPRVTEQKLNRYIKEIGKLANIDTPIENVNIVRGTKKIEIINKHELITTHTARRTAITQMYLKYPHLI